MSLIPLDITQAFSTDLESGVWTYASISTSVLSPAGFPTVRLGPDTTWRQTRELNLNYNPNWVKGLVKPGDRIIWRIKARTDLEGGLDVVNTPYTGARLGLDFLAMIPNYQNNVDGRPHSYTQDQNGVWISGDYTAPDGNVLPDNTPVSKFQLPYGRGWTTIEQDVILPDNFFTKDSGGLDLGGSFQIDGLAAWIDVREIDIEAPVYFGDPEFYINPMSVNKVLTISSVGSGHTSPSGTQQYPDGTSVPVSAIADNGNYLVSWTLDGVDVGTGNPISVLMNADHTLIANFAPIVNPYVLVMNGSLYGVTNPAAGMYQFTQNQIVPISATPIGGYMFDHWLKDGFDVGKITEIVMDMSHTLTPVFVQSGGGFMLPLLVGAGLAVGTWYIIR